MQFLLSTCACVSVSWTHQYQESSAQILLLLRLLLRCVHSTLPMTIRMMMMMLITKARPTLAFIYLILGILSMEQQLTFPGIISADAAVAAAQKLKCKQNKLQRDSCALQVVVVGKLQVLFLTPAAAAERGLLDQKIPQTQLIDCLANESTGQVE